MQTVIFYFSATGNSLHIAKTLAAELGECSLVPIISQCDLAQIDVAAPRVGIVFPTHYFGLPPLVRDFLRRLRLEGPSYVFAVATSGSSSQLSSALHQAAEVLAEGGVTLNAGYHVSMISSYTPLSDIPPASKVEAKLTQADAAVAAIAQAVSKAETSQAGEYCWPLFTMINTYWRQKQLPGVYRNFRCSDSCVSCGICERSCPVGNIRLREGRPEWQDNCQECLACLHLCPTESINYGARTAGRRRYHHPRIKPEELIAGK